MPAGRPTKYNKGILEKTKHYLDNYEEYDDIMPSIVGLSLALDINRDTLYNWADQEDKKEFSDMLRKIMSKQHQVLFNSGLDGKFNAAITKLALTKHGYNDKVEQEQYGKGGGPIDNKWTVEFINAKDAGK